jgi:hypothetical protein
MRTLPYLLSATVLLAACKDENAIPRETGEAYFPMAIGTWVEYQVDSMWRDDYVNVWDSVSYRLLERIEEAYTDPAGRPAVRIKRYVRDADGAWVVRDVWTATRNERFAEKTEEDQRMLKLSFPVTNGRRWNVHAFIPDPELEVAARDVHRPLQLTALSFDSTITVRHTVPSNPITRRDFEEWYARGVGLVAKRVHNTNTQTDALGNVSVKGERLVMEAVAYGN